jgi:phosphatidylserine/phosphatidylglycerophosphate/cardiolipin synthase-like enzyme
MPAARCAPRLPLLALAWLALAVLLAACEQPADPPAEPTPASDWYSLYFTQPQRQANRGGPDAALAEAIDQARLSVEVAVFDLNLWSIRDALLAAHRRGVDVRLVTESDNLDEPEVQELIEAGIPVLGDRREGLMHHKFTVIDGLEVWTGSLNYTLGAAYDNDNNLIRIRSTRLAENYRVEFAEMFERDDFGPGSRRDTPNPELTVEGVRIVSLFSPDDGAADRIIEALSAAQESIFFMAYSFTSDPIAEALIERLGAGVQVQGVMETDQARSNTGGEYQRLQDAGVEVYLDGNPDHMHHKVFIIDGQVVITGSYNFSASAETRNDENLLIVYDPQIAAAYLAEYRRVLAQARR